MSYILEALKKADQERNLGQVPTLASAYPLPPTSSRRIWPWLLLLATTANIVLLVGFLYMSREKATVAQASGAPVSRPPATSQATEKVDGIFSELTTKQQTTAASVKSSALTDDPQSGSPAAWQSTPTDAPYNEGPDLTSHTTAPASTTDAWTAQQEPPPLLQSLPMAFRRTLPPLSIDVHVYSETPEKRFVLINAKRYREGDAMDDGPLLEAITMEGTVLRYADQRFLLPVHR